eukprot:NODE_1062_length_503_cov_196.186170_g1052_i0.p3 GENE.NODE_1062_length_503_cov_196.186170_g1052_i0~~NODE_1062_length_503_cov_196.186170_g1052_i0.p3  ORF type:complete len:50 (+),score=7.16 NODE_1062_length_503_cov_196.186170_g1052_i0:266-415(+)
MVLFARGGGAKKDEREARREREKGASMHCLTTYALCVVDTWLALTQPFL